MCLYHEGHGGYKIGEEGILNFLKSFFIKYEYFQRLVQLVGNCGCYQGFGR